MRGYFLSSINVPSQSKITSPVDHLGPAIPFIFDPSEKN